MSAKAVKSYQKPASPLRAGGPASRFAPEPILSAARAVVEHLEGRQLMAADPFANENDVQGVPFVLDFDGSSTTGLHDKDGEHIGFTRVQVNNNGRDPSYVASLIDQVNGTLRITTTGNATAGTNFNADNTLTNAVETTFNGSSSGFVIQARLIGPMSYINEPSEQAGISFGPGQDNYVKLVAVSRPEGTRIQFVDEELVSGTTFNHVLDATRDIGSFASVNSLDLRLVGDAATGKVKALYSVNGGAFQAFTQELTLTGTRRAAFFSTTARAGLVAAHKNNTGAITAVYDRFEIQPGTPVTGRPSVAEVNPRHQATNVLRDQFVSAQLNLTGGGIDSATLTDATVRLYRTSDRRVIDASVGTSGAGDVIILTPNELLDKNTNYTFEVTDGLHDVAGNAFVAFSSSFTTGTTGGEIDPSFSFEKVDLPNAKGEEFTALAVGPDGKLYAGTVDGRIFRYVINSNGTLGSSQELKVVQNANGGNKRLLTGLAFQPGSTAANPILWVTHGQYRFGLQPNGSNDEQKYADDWTGKISKITNLGGSNTGTLVDIVTGLPRSVRDHLTNQPSFGPDGALYIPQGSNSAGGAPDVGWGNRPERKLSGAVLRLAPAAFTRTTPLNVKTEEGGTYDPFATGAQLTVFASGVRNAYDLVWTEDGFLYAPTNGTAKGANTPGTTGVPALNDIPAQHDFLFRIVDGGYYGHPNPTRGEYVFGAGHTPADGVGPQELPQYGGTINPDADYRGFAYDFDLNISPNGILEYKNASAFGGRLRGKMIVARYSGPNDLMILTKDASGAIVQAQKGIAGFGQLEDPLDIVENTSNGFLYVSEYSERDPLKRKITLLRPIAAGATATPDKPRLVFTDIQNASTGGTAATAAQTVTIRNTGTQPLTIPAGGVTIIDDPDPSTPGNDASQFEFVNLPTLPATVAVGETISFQVRFKAASTGLKGAFLRIQSNATNNPDLRVALRGIGTTSDSSGDVSGANEASLQRILDAFQIPVNVGDSNGADTYDLPTPRPAGTLHDEIEMQRLVKAGAGPVVIEPLAEYAFNTRAGYVAHLGYYSPGTKDAKTEVTRVDWTERTSTNPTWGGSFDPGTSPFGLYGEFPSGSHSQLFEINGLPRGVYSEDVFNTWDTVNKKKVRFFPLKNADGSEVSNAYVFAFEEFNSGYDSNDVVGIIRNVRPAASGPEIGTQNVDRQPSTEAGGTAARALNPTRLSFNRIQIQPPDPVRNENGTITNPPLNVVHDQAKLRIRNSGDSPLTINSLVLSNTTHFQLVSPPAAGTVIAAGGFVDVTVKFIATSGRIKTGTLTINSNDADESATTIDLVGYWQSKSENNEEPTMPEFMQLFGYGTQMTYPGEQLSLPTDPGKVRRTGDEVLSAFWRRANPAAAVEVIQLAAFHSQGNVAVAKWHYASSFTTNNIFTHDGEDGQSILPRLEPNGLLAANTFKPVTQGSDTNPAFGFRFDNEWSDPSRNPQEKTGGGYGHHVRFWVAKDLAGKVIPNTYIVGMDYSGINYDYQDNLYVIRNIKPVTAPSAPTGATATASGAGIALNWADNAEANLAGYNVYRGTTAGFTPGAANKLNTTGLLTASDYNDIFAPTGATSFYKISAVDASGNESGFTAVSATRGADTTAPAAPGNLVVTGSETAITLDWDNNTESDLAGYDVLRSTTAGGTFTLLNTGGLLTTSSYVDSTAATGVTYFYRVVAKDQSGNTSAPATGSGQRGAVTAPAAPANLDAVAASPTQVNVSWSASAGAASYRLERRVVGAASFDEIATNVLTTSFQDTGRTPETAYEYRVRAENSAGLSPYSNTDAATTPATPTTAYTGVDVGGAAPAGSSTASNNDTSFDITGGGPNIYGNADGFHFVYRSVTGDFDFKARVASLGSLNSSTKGGLMARATTAGGSTNVFAQVSQINGYRLSRRATDGGSTSLISGGGAVSYPNTWVRLQRVGNTFTAYKSTDGTNWTPYTSATQTMPTTLLLGMAVTSGTTSATVSAQFRDVGDTNPAAPAPGVPGNLQATGSSTTTVDLAWQAGANAASYRVERKGPGDADFVEIAANVTATTYQDTGRTANTTYEYRVRSVSASGTVFSAYSNVDSGTTLPDAVTPPGIPANLDAVAFSPTQVNLSWGASSGAASYRIERRILGAASFDEIASGVTTTSYQDTGRTPETTYEYRVRAENAGGLSDYSNTDSATTPADTTPTNPVALRATADAYVRDGSYASQNFGQATELHLRQTSSAGLTREFFLKFDLSGVASVASAKLRLNGVIHHATQTAQVAVFAVSNTTWAEGSITWNNRPASTGAALATQTVAGAAKFYEWDVTQYLAAEKAAGRNVVTLVVRSLTTTDPYMIFQSDEAAANQPQLVVTPQGGDPNPTPAPGQPQGLQATAPSSTQVSLAWQAVSGATSYRVERKGPGDADFVEIAGNVTTTGYQDAGRAPQTLYEYRVRAENAGGLSPYSVVASVTTPAAPVAGYTFTDVGATAPAGSTVASDNDTSFALTGGGPNIYGTADGFHFAHRSVTGDFDVKARLESIGSLNNSTKGGLMARATLDGNSANVFAQLSHINGYRLSRRATAGGATDLVNSNTGIATPNAWVRLRRVGNTFTAFRSTDGVNWVTIGAYTQTMPATLYLGVALTSGTTSATVSAQFRDVGNV